MMTSIFFVLRVGLAWLITSLVLLAAFFEFIFPQHHPRAFEVIPLVAGFMAVIAAFSHIRRVRLISDEVSARTLANRQRRQIEIPMDSSSAFRLVEAAIKELPGVGNLESAADSLQLRAKLQKKNPYSSHIATQRGIFDFLKNDGNQILVTISPGIETCSVTIICEPDRPAWVDWYIVDNGTNLENADALSRAISRRIGDERRQEKAEVKQTITEKELTVAKLNLLHAQVEPHFLYNTLASAQLLTRSDPAKADEMLGNLITYLRHSLPRTEDSLSTIGEELERTRSYLDIMKIRMGSRLHLQIEVPDYLKSVLFPGMMLQTLVENAIKHGLEPKSGGGTIWILARAHENMVAVTVADDGRGFSAESAGTGIGLRNVRERLRLAYGNTAHFTIVANFPTGVAATISVPTTFLQGDSDV